MLVPQQLHLTQLVSQLVSNTISKLEQMTLYNSNLGKKIQKNNAYGERLSE